MKRVFMIVSFLEVAIFIVFGFSGHGPSPPKRPLLGAYSMALQALGTATNKYCCVAAKVSSEWCPVHEWVYTFDANGLEHKAVYVAMEPFNPRGAWPITSRGH
jgi:hypothetical protein